MSQDCTCGPQLRNCIRNLKSKLTLNFFLFVTLSIDCVAHAGVCVGFMDGCVTNKKITRRMNPLARCVDLKRRGRIMMDH